MSHHGADQQQQQQNAPAPQGGFISQLSQNYSAGDGATPTDMVQAESVNVREVPIERDAGGSERMVPAWANSASQDIDSILEASPTQKGVPGLRKLLGREQKDEVSEVCIRPGGVRGSPRTPRDPASAAIAKLHDGHKLLAPGRNRQSVQDSKAPSNRPVEDLDLPLAIYSVTKLRSWRTGYPRSLALHRTYFTTMDPDTGEVTNRWTYAGFRQWMALQKEEGCILLEALDKDGSSTKLKFKVRGGMDDDSILARAEMLAMMLRFKYESSTSRDEDQRRQGGPVLPPVTRHNFPIFSAERHTRHGTRVGVSLIAAPYGLLEIAENRLLRTYMYTAVRGVSLAVDDLDGLVIHIGEVGPSLGSAPKSHVGRLYSVSSSQRSQPGSGNARSDLITSMNSYYSVLGLKLQMFASTSVAKWTVARSEVGAPNAVGETVGTYQVMKPSNRHANSGGTVARELILTRGGYLLERDRAVPGKDNSGGIVSCRPLSSVRCVVRHSSNSDFGVDGGGPTVTIEFASTEADTTSGVSRTYGCPARDGLIVAILDSARCLANNRVITVTDVRTASYRLLAVPHPLSPGVSSNKGVELFEPDPVQIQCLESLHQISCAAVAYLDTYSHSSSDAREPVDIVEECDVVVEACHTFNANTSLLVTNILDGDQKIIASTLEALWVLIGKLLLSTPKRGEGDDSGTTLTHVRYRANVERVTIPIYQALSRLCSTATGYRSAVDCQDTLDAVRLTWKLADAFSFFWGTSVISTLCSPRVIEGRSENEKDKEALARNKFFLLGLEGTIDGLVSVLLGQRRGLSAFSGQPISELIPMVIGSIIESVCCSEKLSTTPEQFSLILDELVSHHRALLPMLESPVPIIIENTALILQMLSTNSPETARGIREDALSSAMILHHFYLAIFSPLEGQRYLSRYLCSLWFAGPGGCQEKRLLRHMVPNGFLAYLKMPLLSQDEEDQLDNLERKHSENSESGVHRDGGASTITKRLRKRMSMAISTGTSQPENFRIFFHVMTKDHALPDLIWNQETRRELRIALESELQSIDRVMEARGGRDKIAWNHQQFTVTYSSLRDEIQVGNVYMRLWLQAGDGFMNTWEDPARLFELLFRRLLGELNRDTLVTNMCVRCLDRLYVIHWSKIGAISDIMILIRTMSQTKSIETQHRLLSLVATLLGVSEDQEKYGSVTVPDNAEQLLNGESINLLCQFVAWGHTNSLQVANLMTSAVGKASEAKMLTDGTATRAGAMGGTSPASFRTRDNALESSSPAVWFVAPAGKTPPPSKSIRGPFRVSQLVELVERKELHAQSLVTSLHTEDYDDDKGIDSSIDEAQLDTGKWCILQEVWQLRWQLFNDGSSSGVYGPADLALMSLRSLSRLVDLHQSVDPRGIPYFPVPIAKRLLCGMAKDSSISNGSGSGDSGSVRMQDSLSVISQALLCNDHRVVETAAALLQSLMTHNDEGCSKLYLSGIFFFACMYTGSNFTALAKLLHDCHLKQAFRSGYLATATVNELPVEDRSILCNLLPEGLILTLVNSGYERFSDVFIGSFDTPEVIWSFDMRKHLIEMIRQHLGDFPERLKQNTTTKFDYCPMPSVSYRRLEKELFCHNYYLRNLCNEDKFPDWPINDPVEVFRSCLNEWKKQMSRDQLKEVNAEEESRKVLGLKDGDGGLELRKAYRSLARRYHPDKNPAGREMFEKIQFSYEILLPVVEEGGKIRADYAAEGDDQAEGEDDDNIAEGWEGGRFQMQNVHLLLKTQLLIYKRHAKEMSAFKYPAYSMLLATLAIPPSDASRSIDDRSLLGSCLLKPKRAEVVQTAASFVFESCLVSPLNAEELVLQGGMSTLVAVLHFYLRAMNSIVDVPVVKPKNIQPAGFGTIIDVVHTIGGVAFFENGRKALLELDEIEEFSLDWRRCIDGTFESRPNASLLKKYALEGLANMARSAELQGLLLQSGILWPLVRCLLNYDPTLENVAINSESDDGKISQASSNEHAVLAARALGMLCGVMHGDLATPSNKTVYEALRALLTKPIAKMLRNQRSIEMLRTLNTNAETPVFVWNVQMREELKAHLNKMEKVRAQLGHRSIEEEFEDTFSSFEYSNLSNEVVIGGIYLRIFNALGGGRESIHRIHDCSLFAKELIRYVARCLEQSDEVDPGSLSSVLFSEESSSEEMKKVDHDIEKDTDVFPVNDRRFILAFDSLRLLVRIDGLVDDVLCEFGSPGVLLHSLQLPQANEAFTIARDILSLMSAKQVFADAIANQNEIWRLLRILERPDESIVTLGASEKDSGHNEEDTSIDQATAPRQDRAWEVLESLSSSSSVALALVNSGGFLELLGILVGYSNFTKLWAARLGAATILSRLLWSPDTASILTPLLQKFLPHALISTLKNEGAEKMLQVFDKDSETPELIWDSEMRKELRNGVKVILDDIMNERHSTVDSQQISLPAGRAIKYLKLEDELYIGGVYVRLFLKEPTFSLRDPKWFMEALMLRWNKELNAFLDDREPSTSGSTSVALVSSNKDVLDLITSASVYISKLHDSLCIKLGDWGHVAKGIAFIHQAVSKELVGAPLLSAVRLIHVAASQRENVEAMAMVGDVEGKGGLVEGMLKAINGDPLHTDAGLMVETLEKVFKEALGDINFGATTSGMSAGKSGDNNAVHVTSSNEPDHNSTVVVDQNASEIYLDHQGPMGGDAPAEGTSELDQSIMGGDSTVQPSFVPGFEPMGGQSSVKLEYAPGSDNFYAMPPSPAPGLERVSKNEDPLSFMGAQGSAPAATPPSAAQASNPQQTAPAQSRVTLSKNEDPLSLIAAQGPVPAVPPPSATQPTQLHQATPVPKKVAPSSFAARSQAAYLSSPTTIAPTTQRVPQQSIPASQPLGFAARSNMGFAARSQMMTHQQPYPQMPFTAQQSPIPTQLSSHSHSIPTPQVSSYAARSQALSHQQQPPRMQPTSQQRQTQARPNQGTTGFAARSQALLQQHGQVNQATRPTNSMQQPAGYALRSQMSASTHMMNSAQPYAPMFTGGAAGVPRIRSAVPTNGGMAATQQQHSTGLNNLSAPASVGLPSQQVPSGTAHGVTPNQQAATGLHTRKATDQLQALRQQQQYVAATITQPTLPSLPTQTSVIPAPAQIQPQYQYPTQAQQPTKLPTDHASVASPPTANYQHAAPSVDTFRGAGQPDGTSAGIQDRQEISSTLADQNVVPQSSDMAPNVHLHAGPYSEFPAPAPAPAQAQAQAQAQIPLVASVPAPPAPPPAPAGGGFGARMSDNPTIAAEQMTVALSGAPGSARGRAALLTSALHCNLPRFLVLEVLENPALEEAVADPAAARVRSIGLLKLLIQDPAYGMKFGLILDGIPEWGKYRDQDHSLFITKKEQGADYYLTDGAASSDVRLLTDKGEGDEKEEDAGGAEEGSEGGTDGGAEEGSEGERDAASTDKSEGEEGGKNAGGGEEGRDGEKAADGSGRGEEGGREGEGPEAPEG